MQRLIQSFWKDVEKNEKKKVFFYLFIGKKKGEGDQFE